MGGRGKQGGRGGCREMSPTGWLGGLSQGKRVSERSSRGGPCNRGSRKGLGEDRQGTGWVWGGGKKKGL